MPDSGSQTLRRGEAAADGTDAPLMRVIDSALHDAKRQGATSAEAAVSRGQGMSVSVRLGDVETVEYNRDKSLGISVYIGHRTGSASTSDFSDAAIRDTVRAACTIAKNMAEDPYNGLADVERLATEFPELDLYHPWDPSMDTALELATRTEDAARGADSRITNSEGGSVSSHSGTHVYANSLGFCGAVHSTSHSISCAVVASSQAGMQRDYWYSTARDAAELEAPEQVGEIAAQRSVRRLDARQLGTRQAPVVYEAPVAGSLLSHLVSAVRGSNLYRKATFLLDHIGQPVFADWVRIHEQPHLPKASGSAAFDSEGVATQARDLVSAGVLQGYVLDSYSARKLGLATTGNAGGAHNLTFESGPLHLPALLQQMGEGLLVTELIGFGVNTLTGDYSRGAAGFWVENGVIQYPVEEITVAGNLKQMFRNIAAVGADQDRRGNIRSGSILIEDMTIAGA